MLFGQVRAQDCSGHGQLGSDGTTCTCENSEPGKGQWGWTGKSCELRVFGVAADGSDVTQSCQDQACHSLAPDEWMCYSAPLTWKTTSDQWNYLTVQLSRTSADDRGDPDIYGLFYGGTTGQGKVPEKRSYGYDFRETSSSSHLQVVKSIKRDDFGADSDYTGVYLCIKAYGEANVSYSLRALTTQCPSDFTAEGDARVCSALVNAPADQQRSQGCTAEGQCICKPPWNKPVSEVYPGLGFEDCSAKVTNISSSELTQTAPYVKEHEEVAPAAWSFYKFDVADDDYQVVVNVAGERDSPCASSGYMELFLKYGQPPDYHYSHYDFRPAGQYYYDDDSDLEVTMDPSDSAFQRGVWFAGVNGDDRDMCRYTITFNKYECPLNCSGRGDCVHESDGKRKCDCHQGYFGDDCSGEASRLTYDQQVSKEESSFEYDYYQLPEVSPTMLTHNVEVRIVASFSSSEFTEWSAAVPEMLLLNGDVAAVPTAANHTFKLTMEKQNTDYEINLCPSMLSKGTWRVAIYNPLRLYKIAYKLAAQKLAHCLNDCNGNGDCDADGMCRCRDNWTGGDCSVNQQAACQPGSRQGVHVPESHGTCWSECKCEDGYRNCKYETQSCVDFTCEHNFRRRGSSNECIQDECTKDRWSEADSHSCLQECVCPADGSACKVADACLKDSFTCKDGYKRFSNGDTRCYKVGCESMSLQAAMSLAVDNGKAYGVCTCGTTESEDHDLCSYQTSDLSQMAVACNDGYALVDARKLQGSDVYVAGRCVHAKRGTPGWGVFLWIFFSLLTGAAGGIGALWWHEHRYKRSGLNDSLYHELSMDTGF
ncbi:hypothetical protein WJX72_008089 [[Myrmecia] bisecta]|uniref:EGF-like domain-containing protein n=1 Tax=[Myrmecia] bisecta TaxID=41462 RepID=A0AAW1QSE3_9CHLO